LKKKLMGGKIIQKIGKTIIIKIDRKKSLKNKRK
jgi:hypothetical protein